jgi:fibronectin-binding autotransporter adhesin
MRRNQLAVLGSVSAAALAGMKGVAHASSVAQDVSTNYTTYSNFNAQNLGTGFGAWNVVQVGTTGGSFVDTAANGGFDIYDNGTQNGGNLTDQVSAIRPFTGAMTTGQDFSFTEQLHYASNPTNGGPSNLGFSLNDSTGNPLFDFHIQGGGSGYLLTDATQSLTQTTVFYNYNSNDTFSFTLNNATTGAYTFTVAGASLSTPQTFTGTISTATGGVAEGDVYNNNGGGGSDLHFDNFSLTNGGSVWGMNGSGDWNNAANWTNAIVPNAPGAIADFFAIITAPETVYSNTAVTAGTVSFNNLNTYVIAGAGSLTLQASTGSAQIVVQEGTHTIQLPTTFASNTTLNVAAGSTLNLTNAVTVNSGATVTQTGTGAVNYSNIVTVLGGAAISFGNSTHANTLSVAATGNASLAGGSTSVVEVNNLSNAGTIDVGNSELLINYGSGADPFTTVKSQLASGYNGGHWNGVGINSSHAAASGGKYGVGLADGKDGIVAGLPSGQVEVKFALYGDLNLDGVVNGTDFGLLAANFGKSITGGWDRGDLNYDGTVNGTDFGLLAANFGKSASGSAVVLPASQWAALDAFAAANGLGADVPEPASVGLIGIAAGGLLARRRQRKA